jgi:DNA-directed RNA polymerase I and III subunit RPAC2
MEDTGFIERNAGAPAFGSAVPIPEEETKISIIQDANLPHCATFQLKHEDHTLGNALRYLLMKDRDVDFAGYAIPHPSKPVIHLHVQTKGIPASDAFERSLKNFDRIGNHMLDTFRTNLQSFKVSGGMDMD